MELTFFTVTVLLALCLQNAAHSLFRRVGSTSPHDWMYEDVLLGGELMKLVFSVYMTSREPYIQGETLAAKLIRLTGSSTIMLPPAIAFCLMNVLSYWALERIDTTVFTVLIDTVEDCIHCRDAESIPWSTLFMGEMARNGVSDGGLCAGVIRHKRYPLVRALFFPSTYVEGHLLSWP